jgi:hypothetical protein
MIKQATYVDHPGKYKINRYFPVEMQQETQPETQVKWYNTDNRPIHSEGYKNPMHPMNNEGYKNPMSYEEG